GLLKAEPEMLSLPAEATAISFGQLDEDSQTDLVVATGQTLLIVNNFVEQLSLDKSRMARTPLTKFIPLSFPYTFTSIVIGQFLEFGETDIALLTADGDVRVISKRKNDEQNKSKRAAEWSETIIAQSDWLTATHLVRGRMSNNSTDDLILADPTNHRLHILTDNENAESPQANDITSIRLRNTASFDIDNEPIALLPLRLNSDALDDMVILRKNKSVPMTVVTQTAMTFTVTNTNDSGIGSFRQ